jgi:hypothetical protein
LIPLDAVPAGILVGVRPADQPRLAARLAADRRAVTWAIS